MDQSSNIYEAITNTATISLDTLILNGNEITNIQNIPAGSNIYDYLQWDGTQYVVNGSNNKNIFGKNSNPSTYNNINILNASGATLTATVNDSSYIRPLRNIINDYFILYNPSTYELTYSRVMNAPEFNTSTRLNFTNQSKLLLTDINRDVVSSLYGQDDLGILSKAQTWSNTNTFSNPIVLSSGTQGTPGLCFSGDSNTGIFHTTSGGVSSSIAFTVDGTPRLTCTTVVIANGQIRSIESSATTPGYSFTNGTTTGISKPSGTQQLNFITNAVSRVIITDNGLNLPSLVASKLLLINNLNNVVSSDYNITELPKLALNNTFSGINTFSNTVKLSNLIASKILLINDVNNVVSSSYNITDIAIKGDNNTFSGINTFSNTVKLSNLVASKLLLINDVNNVVSSSYNITDFYIKSDVDSFLSFKAPLASPAFTGQITVPLGSVGAPSIAITGDLNSGIYSPSADNINITTGGTDRLNVSNLGLLCQDIRVNSGVDGYLTYFQPTTKYLSSLNPMSLPINTLTVDALALKAPLASPTFTGTLTTPAINISGQTASKMLRTDGSKNIVSSFYDESNIQAYVNNSFELNRLQQTTTFSMTSNGTTTITVNSISTGSIFDELVIPTIDINLTPYFFFNGSISGTTLTLQTLQPRVKVGCILSNYGILGGTKIISGSGLTWTVNTSQTRSMGLIDCSQINFTNLIITSRGTGSGGVGTYIVNQTVDAGTNDVATTGTLTTTSFLSDTTTYAIGGTNLLPSYSFKNDLDTGVYSGTANTINFTCGGVRECSINSNGFYNSDGTSSFPSFSFLNDTDTGIYTGGIANTINYACGASQVFKMETTAITSYQPIRTERGTASAPSHSFSSDNDCGLYSSTTNNVDISTNGVNRINIDTTNINLNNKVKFRTNAIDSYINSATANTIFSSDSLLNKYISSTIYAAAPTDQWTVFETEAMQGNINDEAGAIAMNGNTTIIINPGDNGSLIWLDEDSMTTANNYAWTGWRISITGVITTSSDRRLKKDIYKIEKENILNELLDIDIVKYKLKSPSPEKLYKNGKLRKKYQEEHIGVIAQNVKKHFEDIVDEQDGEEKMMSVKYQDLTYYFHIGTQQLIQKVKRLEEENKQLNERLSKIESFLNNRFNFV